MKSNTCGVMVFAGKLTSNSSAGVSAGPIQSEILEKELKDAYI